MNLEHGKYIVSVIFMKTSFESFEINIRSLASLQLDSLPPKSYI